MIWFIDDYDQHRIYVTDMWREMFVPKFRIIMTVEEPYLTITWNDREQGTGGDERTVVMDYRDVVDGYAGYISNPSSATDLKTQIEAMIISGWTSIGGGDVLTAKADLLSHDGVSDTILPGGTNEYILSRDNTETTGLKWISKTQVMTPGGSDTEIQYNNGGVLDGDPGLTYDDADVVVSINGSQTMVINGVTQTTHLEVHGEANANHSEIELHRHSTGDGVKLYGARSRGSFATPSIVQSGDVLLNLVAVGYDGTDFAQSSEIEFTVDGTPGSNDMPGRIVLKTSADGAQTPTERMRISANGGVTIAGLAGTGSRVVHADSNGLLSAGDGYSYIIGYAFGVNSTNTTSDELLMNVLIPGGTLEVGDMIEFSCYSRKSSGVGNTLLKFGLNSASTWGGAGYTQYGQLSTASLNNQLFAPRIHITGASAQLGYPSTAATLWAQGVGGTFGAVLAYCL